MNISRPIRARISRSALQNNYRIAQRLAGHAKALAVIKANAYGHGQWRAVEALRGMADGFALLEPENAVALREAGIAQPILLLEGIFSARDARAVVEHRLMSVIHCREQLEMMLGALRSSGEAAPVSLFIKLNTGMNRLGFSASALAGVRGLLEEQVSAGRIDVTWMTHFAEADGGRGISEQLERFDALTMGWQAPRSVANSAAILQHPEATGDWARPGIMLYGSSPIAERSADSFGLKPAMAFESALIGVQEIMPGDRVGYGGTFTATQRMRIGIVACGYADGYPRHAPSGTPIAVMGRRTVTVGRVSMDMLACDISNIPDAGIGAPVTLWGEGLAGAVPADEVATAAGTIAYELFCAVAPRVPVIIDEGEGK